MGKSFEDEQELEVPGTPEEVWAAIATGPGIDSWFMGRNDVQAGPDGTVRTAFANYTPELDVTAWDPPRRFGYRSEQEPDGRFIAYEFLIEARSGGSTVLRAVTSGFIPGEDWADEYEAMTLGGQLFFATLLEYLSKFRGRFARPVTAFGPPGMDWERDRGLLLRALGRPDGAGRGDPVREDPVRGDPVRIEGDGIGPVDGVIYYANSSTIGVRTQDAFYRFLCGFGRPTVAAHQLFAPDADPDQAALAWQSWLARVLSPAPSAG